jgi:hypothetical protein
MKRRILSAAFCLAALSACDKMKEIPNPIGGGSGNGGSGGDAGSPTGTVDAYKAAIASQDWGKMYGLLSAEFQKQVVAEVEGLKRDLAGSDAGKKKAAEEKIRGRGLKPEQFNQADVTKIAVEWIGAEVMMGSPRLPKVIKETKSIKLDDKKASVDFLNPEGVAGTLKFVKENGAWRFAP